MSELQTRLMACQPSSSQGSQSNGNATRVKIISQTKNGLKRITSSKELNRRAKLTAGSILAHSHSLSRAKSSQLIKYVIYIP